MANPGRIHQVNISPGGVPKLPVTEAWVEELGLRGDGHADPRYHGGPERAVCLYSLERIDGLHREGHGIFPGALGENLTVAGLDWDRIGPGDRLEAGNVILEVTKYATPCNTTSPFVSGDLTRYSQKTSPGWSRIYAKVIRGGRLAPGMYIVHQPGQG